MLDLHASGVQRTRHRQAPAAELEEVGGRAEDERTAFDRDAQRHADPAADVLLEPGRAAEALR